MQKHLLARVAPLLFALAASATASAVTISGTTSGLFSNGSATALDGLTYSPNTTGFSVQTATTTGGFFTVGGGGSTHLGQFNLAASNFNYNGATFTLNVAFTSPSGVGSQPFVAALSGQVSSLPGGGANVDFDGARTFTLSNGSVLSFQVNSISLTPGAGAVPVTARGTVTPVPEPSAVAALGVGAVALLRRRKRA